MLFWSKINIESARRFVISDVLRGTNRPIEPRRQGLNNSLFCNVLCVFGGSVFLSQKQDG